MKDLKIENLIFGLARSHYLLTNKSFNELINQCILLGIRRYDVSDYYGFGTTQRRIFNFKSNINFSINNKSGLSFPNLFFKDSVLEYWSRFFLLLLRKESLNFNFSYKEFKNSSSKCLKLANKKRKLDTFFIHEPPSKVNESEFDKIMQMSLLLSKFKSKDFINGCGMAGENIFKYPDIYKKNYLDTIQTSAKNLIDTPVDLSYQSLINCKELILYGYHKVNISKLDDYIKSINQNLNKKLKISIIISSRSSKRIKSIIEELIQ